MHRGRRFLKQRAILLNLLELSASCQSLPLQSESLTPKLAQYLCRVLIPATSIPPKIPGDDKRTFYMLLSSSNA
jgi:hypothetical protein